MSDRAYIQHGRRHGPGGSDPIIGAQAPVIAFGASFVTQTVTHGTTANSSFDDTHQSSDPSHLEWSTTTVANDTLNLIGSGFAMLTASCRWTGGTNVDFKIKTGSGFEAFSHDAIKSFSGFGTASSGSVMPTLMDICWIVTTASPSLPVWVEMTNSDGSDSGPTEARVACIFYPDLI